MTYCLPGYCSQVVAVLFECMLNYCLEWDKSVYKHFIAFHVVHMIEIFK